MYTALLVVWFTLPLATLQSERAKFSFQNMKPKLKFNLNRGVSIHPSTGGKFQRPRKGQVMDSSRPDQQRNPVAIERSSSLEPRSRGGSVEQRSRGGSLDRCDQAGMYVAPTLYHILLHTNTICCCGCCCCYCCQQIHHIPHIYSRQYNYMHSFGWR